MIGNIKHKCLLTEDWGYVGNENSLHNTNTT